MNVVKDGNKIKIAVRLVRIWKYFALHSLRVIFTIFEK